MLGSDQVLSENTMRDYQQLTTGLLEARTSKPMNLLLLRRRTDMPLVSFRHAIISRFNVASGRDTFDSSDTCWLSQWVELDGHINLSGYAREEVDKINPSKSFD